MDAQTFLERLASLAPRPRTQQVVFRGVLAAHSARCALVVPEQDTDAKPRLQNATFRELMKHGLHLEVLDCPHCGARMEFELARGVDLRPAPRRRGARVVAPRRDPDRAARIATVLVFVGIAIVARRPTEPSKVATADAPAE